MRRRIKEQNSGVGSQKSEDRMTTSFFLSTFWLPRLLTSAYIALWLWASVAHSATKVFLHDATSPIAPDSTYLYKKADAAQGSAKVTAVINSASGNITGQFWPSTNTAHILTKTAAGAPIVWISAPLSSGVTISGAITPNLWGLESANQCNCGARYEVLRWDVSVGGIVSNLGISSDGGLA